MDRWLPSRTWEALSPGLRDLALGLGAASATVAALLLEVLQWGEYPTGASFWLALALTAVSGGALALRARLPLLAGVTSAGAYSLAAVLEFGAFVPYLFSAFIVGVCAAHASRRATLALGLAVVAIAMALAVFETYAWYDGELIASTFVGSLALAAVPVAIGDAFRVRRQLAVEAAARAERLEQVRELELRGAVSEERLRLARDVHDVVGHHLSAISIQAGVGEQMLSDENTAEVGRALRVIRRSSATALAETRRMLGLVRGGAERRAPGLSSSQEIDTLARHAERNGLKVTVRRIGEERPLEGVIGDCAYRIVQEALTNVSRHAAAQNALVQLRYGPASLELLVEDDGIGEQASGAGRTQGHGLLGMRERVALTRGELSVGPGPERGWRVRARIPYEPLIR